jgi:hypothetical protein
MTHFSLNVESSQGISTTKNNVFGRYCSKLATPDSERIKTEEHHMQTPTDYLEKKISSEVLINSSIETVWDRITTVDIDRFRFPWYFRILNIPKPVKAEVTKAGVGGNRIAYFDNGKKFIQTIASWELNQSYSFTFSPEDGFRAGYFFDLFNGVFKIQKGSYFITCSGNNLMLELRSDYSIRKNRNWILNKPVYWVLAVFQKYLLHTIKMNCEQD